MPYFMAHKALITYMYLDFHGPFKVINELDSRKSKQTACCPLCFLELEGNKKWIAFYKCGHRTCSECYDDLILTVQQSMQLKSTCPICKAVIEDTITLADK